MAAILADDIFKCIFFSENVWILLKISLSFVLNGPINNIPALVQIMAWRRPGDKPLSEPMVVGLLTHICVTRSQWVKVWESMTVILLCWCWSQDNWGECPGSFHQQVISSHTIDYARYTCPCYPLGMISITCAISSVEKWHETQIYFWEKLRISMFVVPLDGGCRCPVNLYGHIISCL